MSRCSRLLLLAALAPGCTCIPPQLTGAYSCRVQADCLDGFECVAQRCVRQGDPVDAGCRVIDCADPSCAGKACNDGDACTTGETCMALVCSGARLDCGPPPLPCRQPIGTCALGACTWPPAAVGTPCDAGRACNNSGACVPSDHELDCSDGLDDDHDDAGIDCGDPDCVSFSCDAGRCMTGGTCKSQLCVGAPVQCPGPTLCRDAGSCDVSTGACSAPRSPIGSACRTDACINGQTCDANGSCTGGAPLGCIAPGACTSAACDAGACVFAPIPDGGACNDGAACTAADTCWAGACAGVPVVCVPPECAIGGSCGADAGCTYLRAADGTDCANPDGGWCLAGACRRFPFATSNVNADHFTPTGDVLVNCALVVDTSQGGGAASWCGGPPPAVFYVTQAGGEPATVFAARSFEITADGGFLKLVGNRPAIFISWDTGITRIAGSIDARGTQAAPGPGGSRAACGAQNGGAGSVGAAIRGSGGGGAGNFTRGGWGGASDGNLIPGGDGGTSGSPAATPIVGGCRGGVGGMGSGAPGLGGNGGGGLQLSVAGTLQITSPSYLSVSGGGGPMVASSSRSGGGGGGSGGVLVLEAQTVLLLANAWLTANGGGGAEGADADEPGTAGTDGAPTGAGTAPGGSGGSSTGGAGGSGAAGSILPTAGVADSIGGGGGGAAGRIHLRGISACTISGNTSPPYVGTAICP